MGTSSSKQTQTDQQTKPSAQPDPNEERLLAFSVLGNYADFTTTAVIQRCADPTFAVSEYDMTEFKIVKREIQGTKYRISMTSLYLHPFTSFFHNHMKRTLLGSRAISQETIHQQRESTL